MSAETAVEALCEEIALLESRIAELEGALRVIAETRTSWPPHQASNRACYGEAAASIASRALALDEDGKEIND